MNCAPAGDATLVFSDTKGDADAMAKYSAAAGAARGDHKITPLAFYGQHESPACTAAKVHRKRCEHITYSVY